MSETIPVIDIADYVAGRPGALGRRRAPGA